MPAFLKNKWLWIGLVLIIGFAKHGIGFFKLFVPSGVPWPVLFLVVPIEFVSFLLRPITLALRLFGNMLGGHVALKVFAGFIVALGGLAASGGLGYLGIPGAALSLGMVVGLFLLGGAVVTETMFSWPGVGRLAVGAIVSSDFPTAQGAIMILAIAFRTINLIVDVLYVYLDPRMQRS